MAASDPLLSSLCAICNIEPHVYKCPRCGVLTCSLACVKRHKKWASCSGIRNPAAYVQIADLATPTGIDRDYNYLTSLERQLDNAEKSAMERGIQIQSEIVDKAHAKKGVVSLQTGLEKSRAIIIRAPKGMSREKTNATRWLKGSHRLEWTVEWVHPDGRKELGQCMDDAPIMQVYETLRGMKSGGKRKHASMHKGDQAKSKKQQQEPLSAGLANGATEKALQPRSKHEVNGASPTDSERDEAQAETKDHSSTARRSKVQSSSSPPLLFLHAPSLPTKKTVLIPLPPDATLKSSLKERVLLEYPTIYALLHDPDEILPEAFMLEDEYLRTTRKDAIEELEDGEIEELKPEDPNELPLGKVDEKKLLEMLGRDLGMNK